MLPWAQHDVKSDRARFISAQLRLSIAAGPDHRFYVGMLWGSVELLWPLAHMEPKCSGRGKLCAYVTLKHKYLNPQLLSDSFKETRWPLCV